MSFFEEMETAAQWHAALRECRKDIERGPVSEKGELRFVAALVFAEHAIKKQLDFFRTWYPECAAIIHKSERYFQEEE
jgi:hypothetical protein